mgnify:FL=1
MTSVDALLEQQGYVCEPLSEDHWFMNFDAGPRGAALTDWLNDHAAPYHAEGLCKVWILCPTDNPSDVLGYFTLSAHSVVVSDIGKRDRAVSKDNANRVNNLPSLPAQLLGKFALDESLQGKGLGELLMLAVFDRYLQAEKTIGCKFLIVEAREEALANYYATRYGFRRSKTPQGGLIALYLSTANLSLQYEQALNIA